MFNVTINDISVIYVTAHRCAGGLKKKLDLRSGSQRHRHFVGFFNVPVLEPTRDHPFYTVIPKVIDFPSMFTTVYRSEYLLDRLDLIFLSDFVKMNMSTLFVILISSFSRVQLLHSACRYMTDISLNVTLNNQIHLTSPHLVSVGLLILLPIVFFLSRFNVLSYRLIHSFCFCLSLINTKPFFFFPLLFVCKVLKHTN